jgi:hypothetical protein
MAGRGAVAVVDLSFFPGQELLGLLLAQGATESLDAVVAMPEGKPIYQLLVDGRGVAPQTDLRFAPLPLWLTRPSARAQAALTAQSGMEQPRRRVAGVGKFARAGPASRGYGGALPLSRRQPAIAHN